MDQCASIYWERNKPFAHNFLKIQLYLSRFSREAEQREYTYINMYLYKHMEISKEMYYKELAQRITESEKSWDLSWQTRSRSRESACAVLGPVQSAETRRADAVSSRLKAGKLKIQEETIAQFKGTETLISQLKAIRQKEFLLTPGSLSVCVCACSVMSISLRPRTGLQLIGWEPP